MPAFITGPGVKYSGKVSNEFVTVKDITPTLLEVAGATHPGVQYKNRPVHAVGGKSAMPWLSGKASTVHNNNFVEGWELFGRRAIREGDWKLLYLTKPFGPERWQLYNLANDSAEAHDVAEYYPHHVEKLKRHWDDYVKKNGVILPEGKAGY